MKESPLPPSVVIACTISLLFAGDTATAAFRSYRWGELELPFLADALLLTLLPLAVLRFRRRALVLLLALMATYILAGRVILDLDFATRGLTDYITGPTLEQLASVVFVAASAFGWWALRGSRVGARAAS